MGLLGEEYSFLSKFRIRDIYSNKNFSDKNCFDLHLFFIKFNVSKVLDLHLQYK